jgi:hypothetical protein
MLFMGSWTRLASLKLERKFHKRIGFINYMRLLENFFKCDYFNQSLQADTFRNSAHMFNLKLLKLFVTNHYAWSLIRRIIIDSEIILNLVKICRFVGDFWKKSLTKGRFFVHSLQRILKHSYTYLILVLKISFRVILNKKLKLWCTYIFAKVVKISDKKFSHKIRKCFSIKVGSCKTLKQFFILMPNIKSAI